MNLGLVGTRARCATVWTAATAVATLLVWGLLPAAVQGVRALEVGAVGRTGFADLLVWACAVTGLAMTCWLWLLTSAVVFDAGRGSAVLRRGVPATLRRVVLVLCGVALSGSLGGPALAAASGTGAEGPHVLAGLRLPERVAVTPQSSASDHPPAPPVSVRKRSAVVVAPGDTLWGIASDLLGPEATEAATARAWPGLYALNREIIGQDPGLITPGQRLLVPGTGPDGADR